MMQMQAYSGNGCCCPHPCGCGGGASGGVGGAVGHHCGHGHGAGCAGGVHVQMVQHHNQQQHAGYGMNASQTALAGRLAATMRPPAGVASTAKGIDPPVADLLRWEEDAAPPATSARPATAPAAQPTSRPRVDNRWRTEAQDAYVPYGYLRCPPSNVEAAVAQYAAQYAPGQQVICVCDVHGQQYRPEAYQQVAADGTAVSTGAAAGAGAGAGASIADHAATTGGAKPSGTARSAPKQAWTAGGSEEGSAVANHSGSGAAAGGAAEGKGTDAATVETGSTTRVSKATASQEAAAAAAAEKIRKDMIATRKRQAREAEKARVQTSRFLPDSAFRTYFHKTAFHNYGNTNIRPSAGGVSYGNYMTTHNINPMMHPPTERQKAMQAKQSFPTAVAAFKARVTGSHRARSPDPLKAAPTAYNPAQRAARRGAALAAGAQGTADTEDENVVVPAPAAVKPNAASASTPAAGAPKQQAVGAAALAADAHSQPPKQHRGGQGQKPDASAPVSAPATQAVAQEVPVAQFGVVDIGGSAPIIRPAMDNGSCGPQQWSAPNPNDPHVYRFLPSQWATSLIRPAGIINPPSDHVADCLRLYD